jgi:hypothetical protein
MQKDNAEVVKSMPCARSMATRRGWESAIPTRSSLRSSTFFFTRPRNSVSTGSAAAARENSSAAEQHLYISSIVVQVGTGIHTQHTSSSTSLITRIL